MSEAVGRIAAVAGTAILSSALTYLYLNKDDNTKGANQRSTTTSGVPSINTSGGSNAPLAPITPSAGGVNPKSKEGKWLSLKPETKENPRLDPNTLSQKLSLDQVDFDGKRVLVRVDYNVPIKHGVVTDTARIDSTLDTLRYLLDRRGPLGGVKCIVLIAHLGQPTGNYNREDFTLLPAVAVLKKLLNRDVTFLPDCVGPSVEHATHNCAPGSVFLCENLRFHMEEIGSGEDSKGQKVKASKEAINVFQEQLSRLGDVYVFEAFGAAHRPHSSISGIRIPTRVAGKLMQKELTLFSQVLGNPVRPVLAILGGAKVSDKILVIENLLGIVDEMIIGGGMAFTFKKVMDGMNIGNSLFDQEGAKLVQGMVAKAKANGVKLHLPVDFLSGDKFTKDAKTRYADDKWGIQDGQLGMDIGPQTCLLNAEVIWRAKTIFFNGPQGVFEFPAFSVGTRSALQAVAAATQLGGALSIIGGGDSAAAAVQFGFDKYVTHVSTGGGASLELLEGIVLPGIAALSDKKEIRSSL